MARTVKIFAYLLIALASVGFAIDIHGKTSPSEDPQNKATIWKGKEKIKFNSMIFGQFIEHFDTQIYGGIYDPGSKFADADGFRTDVIEAIKELKTPIVRWPGGCFVSSYHWMGGIGSERTPVFDKAWQVEDPNTFGTDEFIKWCQKIGAEPYICTNAGTGTPEEMSDWVEYCNLTIGKFGRMRAENGYPEPHNVKYWSIGNENWGAHELGAKTVDEWGPMVRESAKLMRSVTNDLKLFAAATPNRDWTLPLLKTAGNHLDYVSIHGYWDPLYHVNNISSYEDCMFRTDGPERDIQRTIAILKETGFADRIKIAYDEWNLKNWHHPWHGDFRRGFELEARRKNDIASSYTMADALFSACFLNACLRNADYVEIACFSPIVNTRGAIFVHPEGVLKRTTYHTLHMYANLLEENVVPIETSVEKLVSGDRSTNVFDVILTSNNTGDRFVYAIVNKDPERTIDFELDFVGMGKSAPGSVEGDILTGRSPDDYNDIGNENRVIPKKITFEVDGNKISIPPHSLTFITVE
jgi:alpha-N-arabinofuranosidase